MILKTIQALCLNPLDLLAPPCCPGCGESVTSHTPTLCPSCWMSLGPLGQPSCVACGVRLYPHEKPHHPCDLCFLKDQKTQDSSKTWHQSWSLFSSVPKREKGPSPFLSENNLSVLPFLKATLTKIIPQVFPQITHFLILDTPETSSLLIPLIYGLSKRLNKPFFFSTETSKRKDSLGGATGLILHPYWVPRPAKFSVAKTLISGRHSPSYSLFSFCPIDPAFAFLQKTNLQAVDL